MRPALLRAFTGLAVVMVAIGCSSPSASPGGSDASAPSSGASPSAPGTTSASSEPAVDLTFTGPFAFVAQGSSGTCQIGTRSDGTKIFSFAATDTDYPGLQDGLFIDEDSGSGDVNVKLDVSEGPWFGTFGSGAVLSDDHLSLTLDADLPVDPSLGTEHVSGSITCPD